MRIPQVELPWATDTWCGGFHYQIKSEIINMLLGKVRDGCDVTPLTSMILQYL